MPMSINGEKAASSTPKILEQLANLPSSFPGYIQKIILSEPPLSKEEQERYEEAGQFYANGGKLFDNGNYQRALQLFLQAEENIPDSQQNYEFSDWVTKMIVHSYLHLDMYVDAKNKLEKAIEKASTRLGSEEDLDNYYEALISILQRLGGALEKDSTKQTKTLLELYEEEQKNYLDKHGTSEQDEQTEIKARLALGAIYKHSGKHTESIRNYNKAFLLQQGMLDYTAHYIGQHEVGFSADERIGTTNIFQCVVLILHDPKTRYTALAHMDQDININPLPDIISKFPPNTPLNAYLIGGRIDASNENCAISNSNIKKVTEWLKPLKNVKVISADIGDKGSPHAIVFDPQTETLEHQVPAKISNNIYLRQVRKFCDPNSNQPSLWYAFDLTKSENSSTLTLNTIVSTEQQQKLIKFLMNAPTSKPDDYTEARHANFKLNPVVKVVEEIRENNPQLIIGVFEELVVDRLSKFNIRENKKHPLKISFPFYANKLLNDKTQPLVELLIALKNDVLNIDNNNIYSSQMILLLGAME